jgi:hypothetical protein
MTDPLDKRMMELKRKVEAMGDDIVLEKNFNLNELKIVERFNLKLLVLIIFLLNNMAILVFF